MKLKSIIIFFTYLAFSQATFAIDAAYNGDDGIRAQVFESKCLGCHSSELSGGDRNGAPANVNFDTYAATLESADRAIVRAVEQMSMPPSFSGVGALNQEQKDAMLAWQQAGFPENQATVPNETNNASYNFASTILTLPVVNVGNLTYRATLRLTQIPGSTFGFGFILETAELTDETSTNAATFTEATGILDIPLVELVNSDTAADPVSAQMIFIPNSSAFEFEVTALN